MEAVPRPLPVIVIAGMLGVPPEDRARFGRWLAQRARLLEPTISMRERRAGDAASNAFDDYFRAIVEERRAAPQDDILSALAQVEDDGGRLTERKMLNLLRVLLIAGNETTTNLIGNGVLALLPSPGELERLRDDPGLIPAAVDELLRYDSPTHATFRRALTNCEVNGVPLRRRDNIVVLLGAAIPRSRRVGRSRPAGCRAWRALPSLPRARHPPLPGRPPCAPGGPHRPRDARECLRRPAADIGALARGHPYVASRSIAPSTALRASGRLMHHLLPGRFRRLLIQRAAGAR